jgi:hypothetical protein
VHVAVLRRDVEVADHEQVLVRLEQRREVARSRSSHASLYVYFSDPTAWPFGTYTFTSRTGPIAAAITRRCGSPSPGMPIAHSVAFRPREDRDAVVGLLPVADGVQAKRLDLRVREVLVGELQLLERHRVTAWSASQRLRCSIRTRSEFTFHVVMRIPP